MKMEKISTEASFVGSHLEIDFFFFFLKFQYNTFLLSLHSSSHIPYILLSSLLLAVLWLAIGISLISEEFFSLGNKLCEGTFPMPMGKPLAIRDQELNSCSP